MVVRRLGDRNKDELNELVVCIGCLRVSAVGRRRLHLSLMSNVFHTVPEAEIDELVTTPSTDLRSMHRSTDTITSPDTNNVTHSCDVTLRGCVALFAIMEEW